MEVSNHVALVMNGADAIDEERKKNPGIILNLSGADLYKADLAGANLSRANLAKAFLSRASLSRASLSGADLTSANLSGAFMSEANLTSAQLSRAFLSGANLSRADLVRADLSRANLRKANLSKAILGGTLLAMCDLSSCLGLDMVKHVGPSSVGVDSLISTFRGAGNKLTPEMESFFLGAGVPQIMIQALPEIVDEIKHYSCFVAYGAPDRAFAEKLLNTLRSSGISSWLYPMEYIQTPGEPTLREMERVLRGVDKVIVLCSARSLGRSDVSREIEDWIEGEPDRIMPVSLDDDWTHQGFQVTHGKRDLKPFLMREIYADFSNDSSRRESLQQLTKALERPEK